MGVNEFYGRQLTDLKVMSKLHSVVVGLSAMKAIGDSANPFPILYLTGELFADRNTEFDTISMLFLMLSSVCFVVISINSFLSASRERCKREKIKVSVS